MTGRIFITSAEVAALLEYDSAAAFLSRRAELEEAHDFPPPAPLQRRPLKWRRDAVVRWLAAQGHAGAPSPALAHGLASGKVALLEAARTP